MSITNGKINMEYIHVKENYAPKIGWELGCGTRLENTPEEGEVCAHSGKVQKKK